MNRWIIVATIMFTCASAVASGVASRGDRFSMSIKKIGDQECVVVNGKQGPIFDKVDTPKKTSNGTHVFYFSWKGSKQFVVVDEKLFEQDNHVIGDLLGELVIASDGSHYAYPAYLLRANARVYSGRPVEIDGGYIVLDGKQVGPMFDDVKKVLFSPDGENLRMYVQKGRKWRWEVMKVE